MMRKVCGVLTDIEFQGTKYNTIDVMIKFFEENKYEKSETACRENNLVNEELFAETSSE